MHLDYLHEVVNDALTNSSQRAFSRQAAKNATRAASIAAKQAGTENKESAVTRASAHRNVGTNNKMAAQLKSQMSARQTANKAANIRTPAKGPAVTGVKQSNTAGKFARGVASDVAMQTGRSAVQKIDTNMSAKAPGDYSQETKMLGSNQRQNVNRQSQQQLSASFDDIISNIVELSSSNTQVSNPHSDHNAHIAVRGRFGLKPTDNSGNANLMKPQGKVNKPKAGGAGAKTKTNTGPKESADYILDTADRIYEMYLSEVIPAIPVIAGAIGTSIAADAAVSGAKKLYNKAKKKPVAEGYGKIALGLGKAIGTAVATDAAVTGITAGANKVKNTMAKRKAQKIADDINLEEGPLVSAGLKFAGKAAKHIGKEVATQLAFTGALAGGHHVYKKWKARQDRKAIERANAHPAPKANVAKASPSSS